MAAATTDWLRADCSRCLGLCCVAHELAASADFAIDKPAGQPCPHLDAERACTIHDRLRPLGFPGCVAYDCFGAGQQVVQETLAGSDWRASADAAREMYAVFAVLRRVHELTWHLREAIGLLPVSALSDRLERMYQTLLETSALPAADLLALDVNGLHATVNPLLLQASERLRARETLPTRVVRGRDLRGRDLRGRDLRGADLLGASLSGSDLVGASLRGATLVGADLRNGDLRLADLTGADLRGAHLEAADLSTTLFVTQAQVDSATGDGRTSLPAGRERPAHWTRL